MALITMIMSSSDFNYSGDDMVHRWESGKSEGR